jgi:hypothetical protein
MGKFNLNIDPFSAGDNFSGANLDVKIELQNAQGTSIKIYEITDSLNARIDTTLSAGIYYVIVDGTGNVNNTNDYGSLGAYNINGYYSGTTVPPNPIPNPKDNTGDNVGDDDDENEEVDEDEEDGNDEDDGDDKDDDKKRKKNKKEKFQKKDDRKGSVSKLVAPGSETNQTEPIFKVIKQFQQPLMVVAKQAYEYQVVDNYGRIMVAGKSGPGSNTIDLRNHPSGIYFLRLLNSKERKTEKFFNG